MFPGIIVLFFLQCINPILHGGKALYETPPPLMGFFDFHSKKSKVNPYLKILDFSLLFCCGSPYEEKRSKTLVLSPLKGSLFLVGKIFHGGEGSKSAYKCTLEELFNYQEGHALDPKYSHHTICDNAFMPLKQSS